MIEPTQHGRPGRGRTHPWRARLGLLGAALGASATLAGLACWLSPAELADAGRAAPRVTATDSPDETTPPASGPPSATARPVQPVPRMQPAGQRPGTIRLPEGGTANLVHRDVGPDGVLPIPSGVGQATWWGAGLAAPGGASVFAGHVNWQGATGPFAELWRAQPGEQITVVDAGGRTFTYRIGQVLTVNKTDLPTQAGMLFGQSGTHRLVLVTCGGHWVGGHLGYEENRIVVARPT